MTDFIILAIVIWFFWPERRALRPHQPIVTVGMSQKDWLDMVLSENIIGHRTRQPQ